MRLRLGGLRIEHLDETDDERLRAIAVSNHDRLLLQHDRGLDSFALSHASPVGREQPDRRRRHELPACHRPSTRQSSRFARDRIRSRFRQRNGNSAGRVLGGHSVPYSVYRFRITRFNPREWPGVKGIRSRRSPAGHSTYNVLQVLHEHASGPQPVALAELRPGDIIPFRDQSPELLAVLRRSFAALLVDLDDRRRDDSIRQPITRLRG